jgi:hypothetical protein
MSDQHFIDQVQFNRLCHWANQLCGFYAGAAYLVGSSVMRPDFRDVDVVFVITDEDFEMRYGNKYDVWEQRVYPNKQTEASWRYYKDRIKRIRDGYGCTKLELDVKIQSETEFLGFANMPKIRIDSSPFFPKLQEKIDSYRSDNIRVTLQREIIDERPERITENIQL